MPRAKVPPANRLRAQEACLACRTTKKRCSGTFPCSKCIKAGKADSCVPGKRKDNYLAPQHQENGLSSTSAPDHVDEAPYTTNWNTLVDTLHYSAYPVSHGSVKSTVDPGSPEAPHKTHPRMLRNLEGERVYVGRAASLSFLQLLRDTVTQHIGPSQFSHNVKSEDMLETEAPHDIPLTMEGGANSTRLKDFIRAYHIATSGFIHILSDAENFEMANDSGQGKDQKTKRALRDLIIAIGAQSSKSDPDAVQTERYFFARGQHSAFDTMLENPSLEMVRLFLLMSFYMLGACRRNAAFMYIGVAARAAMALGLHLNDSGAISVSEQHQRVRAWMSLCVLDLLVSSILGRPPATVALRTETPGNPLIMKPQEYRIEESLFASFCMSQVLDEIIVRLYSNKAASTETAESVLEKLKRWSDDLPESLLTSPPNECESNTAQVHIIGSLHIACSYHFAVIIITRPFLISVLGVRLAQLHRPSEMAPDGVLHEDPAHAKLAVACTDSALYMIQTCMEVHHSGLLLGNMCILKAFVFAAALILGFFLFSKNEPDSVLEEAFNGALEILQTLSLQSAQAAHYYEIISFLRSAIIEQRQQLTQQMHQNKSRYVSKLFSLHYRRPTADAAENSVASVDDNPDMLPENALNIWSFMGPAEINSALPGWDGMELPLWDSFPFAGESFQLPDKVGESSSIFDE